MTEHLSASSGHPTLLRHPTPGLLGRSETVLPGRAEDYRVHQSGVWWSVTHVPAGELIYGGPGPVEVVRSPAPF